MSRLAALVDLLFDAVEETTNLVERTHRGVARRTLRRLAPLEAIATRARAIDAVHAAVAAVVYDTIRLVNRSTQTAVDVATVVARHARRAPPALPDPTMPPNAPAAGSAGWAADFAQATVNGWSGDYLCRRGNGLDLGMTIRHHGRVVPVEPAALRAAFAAPTAKVCVFVHGLSSTEWLWSLHAEEYYGDPGANFGTMLQRAGGYTPVFLRYNTGRHISENGRALSALLARLAEAYPVAIDELVLIGHSMGGLVARSAAHYGVRDAAPWARRLRHVVCLGAPHLGAPLEKATNVLAGVLRALDAAAPQVIADVLNSRSAGIKDLRFGYTVDDEWAGSDPDAVLENRSLNVPLADGVAFYFLAATISRDPAHPAGQLLGDLLVRLPSASAQGREPARRLRFRSGRIVPGMSHLDLASHPAVFAAIRGWLGA